MSGDVHVRICEHLGGRFPGVTRLDQAMTHLLTFIDAEQTGEIDAKITRIVSDHRETPKEKRYQ